MLDLLTEVEVPRRHVSLHFDGLLLSDDIVKAVEAKHQSKSFAEVAEIEILKRTGFRITVKEKHFTCFVDHLFALSERELVADNSELEALSGQANSIPVAYAFISRQWRFVTQKLTETNAVNTRAQQRGLRCYKDWHGLNGHYLKPGFALPDCGPTCFLMRFNNCGSPVCLGVAVSPTGQCDILYERKLRSCHLEDLRRMISASLESFNVAFFRLQTSDDDLTDSETLLLDLVAGRPEDAAEVDLRGGGDASEADVHVAEELRCLLLE